jgi:hypothetical protein
MTAQIRAVRCFRCPVIIIFNGLMSWNRDRYARGLLIWCIMKIQNAIIITSDEHNFFGNVIISQEKILSRWTFFLASGRTKLFHVILNTPPQRAGPRWIKIRRHLFRLRLSHFHRRHLLLRDRCFRSPDNQKLLFLSCVNL